MTHALTYVLSVRDGNLRVRRRQPDRSAPVVDASALVVAETLQVWGRPRRVLVACTSPLGMAIFGGSAVLTLLLWRCDPMISRRGFLGLLLAVRLRPEVSGE